MIISAHVPHDQIVFTEFDGQEGVLVDLDSKRYYTLNETGVIVWRALEKGLAPTDIVKELTAIYEVTAEHATASVEKMLNDLLAHKLIARR